MAGKEPMLKVKSPEPKRGSMAGLRTKAQSLKPKQGGER